MLSQLIIWCRPSFSKCSRLFLLLPCIYAQSKRHLSPYVLCSSFESLSGQSSFRPAQSGGLVLVAHEREQLLFLPAAGRPTTSRPLPELVPLVGPPTHNCCHRCNFTMPPVYIKPLLPVKLNCNPSELYFTRLIWCFTKYRYWMRWGQLIVHTTTGTGAGSQCRRYNRPPGPFYLLLPWVHPVQRDAIFWNFVTSEDTNLVLYKMQVI